MAIVLFVGLGGMLGSITRYLVGGWVQQAAGAFWFPYGTLAVNVVGCLLIGFGGGLAEARSAFSPEGRALLFIGFLGGFTTFSSFGFETFGLLRDGQYMLGLLNVALQIMLGLGAVYVGSSLSRLV